MSGTMPAKGCSAGGSRPSPQVGVWRVRTPVFEGRKRGSARRQVHGPFGIGQPFAGGRIQLAGITNSGVPQKRGQQVKSRYGDIMLFARVSRSNVWIDQVLTNAEGK